MGQSFRTEHCDTAFMNGAIGMLAVLGYESLVSKHARGLVKT